MLAGSSGFWAVFILCNDERKDEGRQGITHATCRGTRAPTPTVRRRTAVVSVVCRHCDASEPAQQRAAEALLPLRRLKVFSQAAVMLPLRRYGVGSRLSLNMEPGADGHPGGS